MKKILIVSDIHGDKQTLKNILNENKDVDFKIFCGDLEMQDFSLLDEFDYVVLGNSDIFSRDLIKEKNIKDIFIIKIEDVKILITHGHLFESQTEKIDFNYLYEYANKHNVSLVLHGHNHIKDNKLIKNIYFFNPGSTSFPRKGNYGSYGIIEIDNNSIKKLEHIMIEK